MCSDDVTVCPCEPGQNRVMYNVSRMFRTSEAQRILPFLRHQFGEDMLRQAAQQIPNYAAAENWVGPQTRLLYDVDPPSREAAVTKCRRICHEIINLQNSRSDLFIQSDDSGRVQWSAISIFALFFKFDTVRRPRPSRLQEATWTTHSPDDVLRMHDALFSSMAG